MGHDKEIYPVVLDHYAGDVFGMCKTAGISAGF